MILHYVTQSENVIAIHQCFSCKPVMKRKREEEKEAVAAMCYLKSYRNGDQGVWDPALLKFPVHEPAHTKRTDHEILIHLSYSPVRIIEMDNLTWLKIKK